MHYRSNFKVLSKLSDRGGRQKILQGFVFWLEIAGSRISGHNIFSSFHPLSLWEYFEHICREKGWGHGSELNETLLKLLFQLRFPFVDPGAWAEEVLWIQKRHLSSAMQWLWIIFLQWNRTFFILDTGDQPFHWNWIFYFICINKFI